MKVEIPLLDQTRDALYSTEPMIKNPNDQLFYGAIPKSLSFSVCSQSFISAFATVSSSAISKSTRFAYFELLVTRQITRDIL